MSAITANLSYFMTSQVSVGIRPDLTIPVVFPVPTVLRVGHCVHVAECLNMHSTQL